MASTTKRKPTSIKKKAPAKPTAAKPVAAKAPVAKPATVPTAVAPEVPVLRKKELIERVVARSGIKKKDAKPTIEAMLAVLGEALKNGEELNLQPLGKIKINRVIEKENATVMVAKVRQSKEAAGGTVVKITPKS